MTFYTDFYHILWFFIIYCMAGWIWESCFCSIKAKKWINRGFLLGPYIPIYGCGALSVYLLLYPAQEHLLAVFTGGMILASILEFFTSWIMEKLFAATWWDYSKEKFNIQGRICLKASLLWGFFSVGMVKFLHPAVLMLIEKIPRNIGNILGTLFVFVFSSDVVHTVLATWDIKKTLEKMETIRSDIRQFAEVHNIDFLSEDMPPARMLARLKEQWEEHREHLENLPLTGTIHEYRMELEEKLEYLVDRYEENRLKHRHTFLHHMKSYPNFKSVRYEKVLDDVKKRLDKLRKDM